MKSIVLFAGIFLALTASGQGLVRFANTSSTLLTAFDYNTGTLVPITGTNTFRIGLFVGSSGSSAGSLTMVGLATNYSAPPLRGLFNGGASFVLPAGYPAGTPIAFQIRAWDATAGDTWESARVGADAYNNGGFTRGGSALGFVTPDDGLSPLSGALFGTGPGQVGGFTIAIPIPEPSIWVLGSLATFTFYVARRRRS